MSSLGPEAPGAGSEGSIPKQQAGLHDDELLDRVADAISDALPGQMLTHTMLRRAAVAAVRGAGPTSLDDPLASARGFSDEQLESVAVWFAGMREDEGEPTSTDRAYAESVLVAAVEPGALSAASFNPSGAVPLEPQEEKLREALEWIEGFALVGSGADWDRVAGVARKALSSVPLLQDGHDDV